MTRKLRTGDWPFVESEITSGSLRADGQLWSNVPDDAVVGLVGRHTPMAGAGAELQRRQTEATEELADVQRTLLVSIETFNAASSRQADKMITLTYWIIVLTVVLAILAALQLIPVIWPKGGA